MPDDASSSKSDVHWEPEGKLSAIHSVDFDFSLSDDDLLNLEHLPHSPIRGRWGLAEITPEMLSKISVELRGFDALKKENMNCQEPAIARKLKSLIADHPDTIALEVEYNDTHPLFGGRQVIIEGAGRLRVQDLKKRVEITASLPQEKVDEIVRLLIDLEAWKQRVPPRDWEPDESIGILLIRYENDQSTIWEWFNDIKKLNRIQKFLNLIDSYLASPDVRFTQTPFPGLPP